MRSLNLASGGCSIPMIGYGTGTTWFKTSETVIDCACVETVKNAIAMGYRHLDAAEMYNTEPELGVAIRESGIPRSSFFITTKCSVSNPVDIPGALEASLEKLQLEYIDLYLIHTPFAYKTPSQLQEAWRQMELLQKRVLARAIGVSNCLTHHLRTILQTATVTPAINQIELHPYLQREGLRRFMAERGIALAAYATLTPLTTAKGQSAQFESYVDTLASRYGLDERDRGQVLLGWALKQEAVVITTGRSQDRLERALGLAQDGPPQWELTSEEIEKISMLGKRINWRTFFTQEIGTQNFE